MKAFFRVHFSFSDATMDLPLSTEGVISKRGKKQWKMPDGALIFVCWVFDQREELQWLRSI